MPVLLYLKATLSAKHMVLRHSPILVPIFESLFQTINCLIIHHKNLIIFVSEIFYITFFTYRIQSENKNLGTRNTCPNHTLNLVTNILSVFFKHVTIIYVFPSVDKSKGTLIFPFTRIIFIFRTLQNIYYEFFFGK